MNLDGARLAVVAYAVIGDDEVDLNVVRFLRAWRDGGRHVYRLDLPNDCFVDQTLTGELDDLNRDKVLVGDVDEICDVQVHRVRPEVDHDTLHGHGRQGDAPREEEEEDEAADEETHGHGDEHVQLRASGFQPHIVARYHSHQPVFISSGDSAGASTGGAGVSGWVSIHGAIRGEVLQAVLPLRIRLRLRLHLVRYLCGFAACGRCDHDTFTERKSPAHSSSSTAI